MSQLTKNTSGGVEFLVALGSNGSQDIDQTVEFVQAGLRGLSKIASRHVISSRLFQSEAFPAGSGPDYVNAAAIVQSTLEPAQFLLALHQIEAANGRMRAQRWGQRTLDLDLLGCGTLILPDAATVRRWMDLPLADQQRDVPDQLLLPHPRLHERAFVLLPLCDIAPDWRHPLLGSTVAELADDLPDTLRNTVKALAISDSRP